jgi:hypothetical protein
MNLEEFAVRLVLNRRLVVTMTLPLMEALLLDAPALALKQIDSSTQDDEAPQIYQVR